MCFDISSTENDKAQYGRGRTSTGYKRIVNLGDLYAGQCKCGGRAIYGIASQSGPEGCIEAVESGTIYCTNCVPRD